MTEKRLVAIVETDQRMLDVAHEQIMQQIKEQLTWNLVNTLDVIPKRVEWTEELCKQHMIPFFYRGGKLVANTDRVLFTAEIIVKQ